MTNKIETKEIEFVQAFKNLQKSTSCGEIAFIIMHTLECEGCRHNLREALNSSYLKAKKLKEIYENI